MLSRFANGLVCDAVTEGELLQLLFQMNFHWDEWHLIACGERFWNVALVS